MMSVPGQELDLSMPEGREVKGRLGYLWVQAGAQEERSPPTEKRFPEFEIPLEGDSYTCHKLWIEICEMRQIFEGDLIKFYEIFAKIILELQNLYYTLGIYAEGYIVFVF